MNETDNVFFIWQVMFNNDRIVNEMFEDDISRFHFPSPSATYLRCPNSYLNHG